MLISPIIEYGDILYVEITKIENYKIQKLQNSACRIILQQVCRESTNTMHSELNLHKLDIRRFKHVCNQIYKCTSGMAPHQLCDKLQYTGDVHSRSMRAITENHLVIPDVRSNLSRQNFFFIGPGWWNGLDGSIKQLNTYASFKWQVGKLARHDIPVDI